VKSISYQGFAFFNSNSLHVWLIVTWMQICARFDRCKTRKQSPVSWLLES